MSQQAEVLSQAFTLGYTYTRSTGPVVGRFLTALRDRKIVGIKGSDGSVLVPPAEFDPKTAEELSEFVDVADSGTVVNWTWVSEPRKSHPSDKPFAWALVKLDGADSPMMHWVEAEEGEMQTGMRVKARWAEETKGFITDINGFVPENVEVKTDFEAETFEKDITWVEAPVYMEYNFTAGNATARFLSEVKKGRLVGQKDPITGEVYIPPRGSSPKHGVPTTEEVQVSNKATVESFTIVHIPIPNNPIKPPYVIANLVPDGAHISYLHLISECDNADVRIGMRVEAKWRPEEEWTHAMDNIMYYVPIDEPDVPVEEIGRLK